MAPAGGGLSAVTGMPTRIIGSLKRGFSEFLTLPLAVVIGFVGITVVVYWADQAWSGGHVPSQFSWLGDLLGDSSSLATLLGTIASSIITVTSITFSLLLIALQQGSSALTNEVTDQFLMRRSNQFYFGYFVGLSVFALLSLVTASRIHRPVFGASIIVVLTIVALCMVVVLIYNTIDQMRPTQIVQAIHGHVLKARRYEAVLLGATRRTPRDWPIVGMIRAAEPGHVTSIDVDRLAREIAGVGCGELEVQLRVPIGRYLAFGDPLAILRARSADAWRTDMLDGVRRAVLAAVRMDDARDLRHDASLGIGQLLNIAWTSISTAKSNPAPGEAVVQRLRDILARWSSEGGEIAGDPDALVVIGDAAPNEALDALEHIGIITSESLQAQTFCRMIRTVAILLDVAPPAWQRRLTDVARRSLSSLGEHAMTADLEAALAELGSALDAHGFASAGDDVRAAAAALAQSVGTLNSRSTRVPEAV